MYSQIINGGHVLIIEDELMFAKNIEYVLESCGFDTFDFAGSSQEAIAAAARRCPDLITVDVNLMSGNGLEAIRTICPKRSTAVIVITGRPTPEVRAQISNRTVLYKPFTEQTLTYAVIASMTEARLHPVALLGAE